MAKAERLAATCSVAGTSRKGEASVGVLIGQAILPGDPSWPDSARDEADEDGPSVRRHAALHAFGEGGFARAASNPFARR